MSVRISVDKNLAGVERKCSQAKVERVQRLLTERVGTDSNVHCAYDTGALQRSMTIDGDDQTVRWPMPYAKKVYYGDHVRTEKNPQATPAWFETAKAEHMGDWKKVVEDGLNG